MALTTNIAYKAMEIFPRSVDGVLSPYPIVVPTARKVMEDEQRKNVAVLKIRAPYP